jgi:outer membrane receptor protein involved in Fe transport
MRATAAGPRAPAAAPASGRARLAAGGALAFLVGVSSARAQSTAPASGSPASPPAAPALDAVVVSAERLTEETLIDRKVYSVAADVASTFGTASDILSAIPAIDVDADGTVSLRGDSNVLVLIDGRPSAELSGPNAGEALQSLPAADIERIEVLTTPPPEFKAAGAAGVINIITRRRRRAGTAGTLQGSLGSSGRSSVGASLATGGGPFTVAATLGLRQDYKRRLISSDLATPGSGETPATATETSLDEFIHRAVPLGKLVVGYAIDERDSLSASAVLTGRAGNRYYTELDTSTGPAGTVDSSAERLSVGHDWARSADASLDWTRKLGVAGETLVVSASRSSYYSREHYAYTGYDPAPPAASIATFSDLSLSDDQVDEEVRLDYVRPLGAKATLKLGYDLEDDAELMGDAGDTRDAASGAAVPNPLLDNEFRLYQQIHALYGSYQAATGSWTWLAGLRAELTHLDEQQLTLGLRTFQDYARLYPSVHVDQALTEASTLSFGASRRVSRPGADALNPFVDREYTPNLRAGNAALRPQDTDSVEAAFAHESPAVNYTATAYYRRNRDTAAAITEDQGGGYSLTTLENVPASEFAGLELIASGHATPRLGYSVNANLFHNRLDAPELGLGGLQATNGLNAKLKLDYHPTAADTLQVVYSHTARRLTPQGDQLPVSLVNVGYRRQLGRSLAAVATVSDVFNGGDYRAVVLAPTFTESFGRRILGRVLWFGLAYSFGASAKPNAEGFEYEP